MFNPQPHVIVAILMLIGGKKNRTVIDHRESKSLTLFALPYNVFLIKAHVLIKRQVRPHVV